MRTVKRRPKKREKPGPKEERLVITEDAETALDRLLKPKKTQEPDDPDRTSA